MVKYKCGHKGKPIILDDNVFSVIHYFEWANGDGVFGTRELCFDCWTDKIFKQRSSEKGGRKNG